MARELSSIDFHFLVKELQHLVGERIDQIYSVGKKDFIFQFRLNGVKEFLRITPNSVFIAKSKEIKECAEGFVSVLRKIISGKKITSIEQISSERLVKLETDKFIFYSYFFGNHDKILCDKNNSIIASTNPKKYRKDEKFNVEIKNNFTATIPEFNSFIEKIDKNLAKTLAINLGIGGMYAEEICQRAGIDKSKENLSDEEKEKLHTSFLELLKQKIDPFVVYENNIPLEAIPFEIKKYSSFEKKKEATFNEAVSTVIEFAEFEIKQKQKGLAYENEKERLLKIKDIQEKNLVSIEKDAQELQRAGEIIYEKYQEFKQIIDEANELRKTHSLKEIKELLKKKYTVVKDLEEKDKKILIEI